MKYREPGPSLIPTPMLKNYLFTALRSYWKQKGFTLLNLSGLTLGIATSLMIMLWVVDEINYDRFHQHSDRLYRIMENQTYSGQMFTFDATPGLLAPALKDEIPEITQATRMTGDELQFTVGDKVIKESGVYADPDLFDMFSFPLVVGNVDQVLDDVSSVVISESLAEKYFGGASAALDKTILVNAKDDYTVTGVFADVPANSSIDFDFVLPFEVCFRANGWVQEWGNNGIQTYVLFQEQASLATVNDKIKDFVKERNEGSVVTLFAQSFPESHLHGEFKEGKLSGGRIIFIRLFVVIAIFITLIACINFTNLVTARSAQRAKEIGVRKVIGAHQGSLVGQFLGESMLLVLLATLLSTVIVELLLPTFNQLTDKQLVVPYGHPVFFGCMVGIILLIGLLAGVYPAFFLSSFNTVSVMKGTFKVGSRGAALRQGLVVFQFVLSMVLIGATFVVHQQVQYIKDKDLGLNRENMIYLPLTPRIQAHFEAYKNELLAQPGIQHVSLSNQNPLSVGGSTQGLDWEGKAPDTKILFEIISAGYNFLPTAGVTLKEGRDFSRDFPTDTANVILNEEAVRRIGFESPVGEPVEIWGRKGKVIGVVKDFHSNNLHGTIEPLVIMLRPENADLMMVRTQAGQAQEAVASLEALHRQYDGNYAFEYHFLDESFDRMYRTDTLVGKLATYFSVIAILISCLGLFGLAAYTAERRIKEIGVRKVLGASVLSVVALLSANFTKLVLIAFAISAPLTWYLMDAFLQQYAYHTELSPMTFVLTGLLALVIAWLTVSYQSVKAALANPVDSLKTE